MFKKADQQVKNRGKVNIRTGLPRTSSYQMRKPEGIIVHDTVTPLGGSKWWTRARVVGMVANGVNQGTKSKPKLIPGPLYHFLIRAGGEVVHITDLAWHSNNAGRGDGARLHALQAGKDPLAAPLNRASKTNGNPWYWGIALGRNGKKPMPAAMREALVATLAALFDHARWDADQAHRVIGHREWTARKRDPVGVDMDDLRASVASRVLGAPRNAPTPAKITPIKTQTPPPADYTIEVLVSYLRRFNKDKHVRGGREDVRIAQRLVGTKPDGLFGKNTRAAVNRWLRYNTKA